MVTHGARSPARRLRQAGQLWQVPLFLLGVATLVAVILTRPLAPNPDERQFARDAEELQTALAGSEADWKRVLTLETELLTLADRFPRRAGEAYLLVGSVYLRLSDLPAAERQDYLANARQHLERARTLGVPDEVRTELAYRLARCWHLAGADPQGVIDLLAPVATDQMAEAADAYALLAQAYLRLPTPDVDQAIEANRKLLRLPTTDENLLAPARLTQAELLARRGDTAEAREVLLRIGISAPAPVRARARALLAEVNERLGDWSEAAKLWQAMLVSPGLSPDDAARVHYQLGRCFRELAEPEKAEAEWMQIVTAGGDAGQAALIELGDLLLLQRAGDALNFIDQGLRNVAAAGNYHNSLIELRQLQERLKAGCQQLRDRGEHERAQRLAGLFARVANGGEAEQMRGQVEEAWGAALRTAGSEEAARLHYCAAGDAYNAAAAAAPAKAERAAALRRAADLYRAGQDYRKAVESLQAYVAAEPSPELAGVGLFDLAETYEQLRERDRAHEAYLKCMEYTGPAVNRARFRLAQWQASAGNLEEARQALLSCLEVVRNARVDKEERLYIDILLALADVYFREKDYQQAAARYEEALQPAPDHPGAIRARYHLAESYRRLAEAERLAKQLLPSKGSNIKATIERNRDEKAQALTRQAVAHYQKLTADLIQRRLRERLPDELENILRQADFELARSLFQLGDFPAARAQYETLASRYQSQLEQLIALSGMYQCYYVSTDLPDGKQLALNALVKMQEILPSLSDKVFQATPGAWSRQQWADWVSTRINELSHGNSILRK